MGMGVLLFLVGWGWFSSFAQSDADYSLIQFGNSAYVNKTRNELIQMIDTDDIYLSQHECNLFQEYQLFTKLLKFNPRGDSLRVISEQRKTKVEYWIQNGILRHRDGSVVSSSSDPWIQSLILALKKIKAIPEGSMLLDALEHAYDPLILKKGMNRFSPQEPNGKTNFGLSMASALMLFQTQYLSSEMPFYQMGIGGVVFWNPNAVVTRIESDQQARPVPPFIALAHELFHAYDSIRGLLDVRFVKGANYEMTAVTEYRAVFFEDIMRAAYGMLPAKYYSESDPAQALGKPSLLDSSGKPRWLSAPCVPREKDLHPLR